MDPLKLIEQYYLPTSEAYKILVAHGEDVASLALEIAEYKPELGADKAFLYEASMLHDIGVYLTDAPDIGCHGVEPYIRHGYLGAEILRHHGLERHADVAERHTGAGLEAEEIAQRGIDLPLGRIYSPQTLEERIICYADKFYSKTKLGRRKDLDKVRLSLLRHGKKSLHRFDLLHEEFGR